MNPRCPVTDQPEEKEPTQTVKGSKTLSGKESGDNGKWEMRQWQIHCTAGQTPSWYVTDRHRRWTFFSRDTRYTGASHHDVVPSTFPRGDTAATIHWRIEIFFFRGLVVCDSCLYSWFFFTGASRIRSRTGSTKFARVYEALTAWVWIGLTGWLSFSIFCSSFCLIYNLAFESAILSHPMALIAIVAIFSLCFLHVLQLSRFLILSSTLLPWGYAIHSCRGMRDRSIPYIYLPIYPVLYTLLSSLHTYSAALTWSTIWIWFEMKTNLVMFCSVYTIILHYNTLRRT